MLLIQEHVSFTEDFFKNLPPLSWGEIFFGYENKLLSFDLVCLLAKQLVDSLTNPLEEEFALAYFDTPYYEFLEHLKALSKKDTPANIQEKWVFLLVRWVYENKDNFEDISEIIALIYCDFEHPEELRYMVPYQFFDESFPKIEDETDDEWLDRYIEDFLKKEIHD